MSPRCNPAYQLSEAIAAYRAIGFRKFAAMTGDVDSALSFFSDPQSYRHTAERFGMGFSVLYLPPVVDASPGALDRVLQACRFAALLGVPSVVFRARGLETALTQAPAFLDQIEGLGLRCVLGGYETLRLSGHADLMRLRNALSDPRLGWLLDLGGLRSQGIPWRDALRTLGTRPDLVCLSDWSKGQSVPLGQGEIDLHALVSWLQSSGYDGDLIVELDVVDSENTLMYLAEAMAYLRSYPDRLNFGN